MEALFRPVLILMSGRSIGFAAAFVIPLILARVFDQTEFGTYKQLFLILGTLFGIAQLGMAESLYYFLPFESRRGGRYVFNTMLLMLLSGSLCLVLLVSQQSLLAGLLNNANLPGLLPYIGLSLLFLLIAVALEIVMTVRKQHVQASVAYGLSDLARASFYLIPVLLFGTLQSLLFGAALFAFVRTVVTLLYFYREYGRELRLDTESLRSHLWYALPFGLAGLIEVAQLNYHMYAVSYYFDPATFAIYAVGCLQIPLIDILMTSTSNVMMVNMREKVRAGEVTEVLSIWLDSVRKLSLVLWPLVGLLLLLGRELIILLFTESYEDSVPVFMVWTLSMLLVIVLSDGVLRVYADNRFLIIQNLIRLGIIVMLMSWFLERYNVIGAVLVTLLATLVIKLVALIRIKSLMRATLSQLLPWRSLAAIALLCVTAAVPSLAAKNALLNLDNPLPVLLVLSLVGILYSFCYYLLLLWLGPLARDEKQMLMRWSRALFCGFRGCGNR